MLVRPRGVVLRFAPHLPLAIIFRAFGYFRARTCAWQFFAPLALIRSLEVQSGGHPQTETRHL